MGKIIYINGGILINTPYFKCPNAGAYYDNPPFGAEIWQPNKIDENGYEYLEINDEYPQSIFNEYYAKYEFASYYTGVEFLYKSFQDAYDDYLRRIKEVKEVFKIKGLTTNQRIIINRLSFISIIASLETFICDTILTAVTNFEDIFENYCEIIPFNQLKFKICEIRGKDFMGVLEQRIIEYIMKQSYSNIVTIKDAYKKVLNFSIVDKDGKIAEHFRTRHKLAHRNGRNKDGSYIEISNENLDILISDLEDFVNQVMDKINQK